MVDMLRRFIDPTELVFNDRLPIGTSDKDIAFIQGRLNQMAQSRYQLGIQGTDDIVEAKLWPAGQPWSQAIYRRYFHFSADFHKTGMAPHINGNGKPSRLTAGDHG